jgi:hypothetical protein
VNGFIRELEAQVQHAAAGARAHQRRPRRARGALPARAGRIRAPAAASPAPVQSPALIDTKSARTADEGGAHGASGWRTAAITLGAVGALGMITAAASWWRIHSLEGDVTNAKPGGITTDQVEEHQRSGQRYAKIGWVGAGVGVLAITGAAACLLLDPGAAPARDRSARLHLAASPLPAGAALIIAY